MLIEVKNLATLNKTIEKIIENSPIETQYKLLKIQKAIKEELLIISEQKKILVKKYAILDKYGKPIIENNKVKIKENLSKKCVEELIKLNNLRVSMPDLFFTLEELQPLGLTFKEIIYFKAFIKS